jgi:hypothetical protein
VPPSSRIKIRTFSEDEDNQRVHSATNSLQINMASRSKLKNFIP